MFHARVRTHSQTGFPTIFRAQLNIKYRWNEQPSEPDRIFSFREKTTGCLQWIDVAQSGFPDGFWSVVLHDINVGGSSVLRSSAPAILDTGTSMIVGPFEDVAYLANEIGALCVSFTGVDSSSVEPVSD